MKKAILIILALFLIPAALSIRPEILAEKNFIDSEPSQISNVIITDISATLSLNSGWNLISIPIKPDNTSVENVLSSIAGKYISVWAYDNVNQKWTSYNPSVPSHMNDLHNLDETMGFWIEMNESSDLTVAGTKPAKTTIPVYNGWNYIGYPHNESQNVGDAFELTNETYYVVWKCNDQSNCTSYVSGLDSANKFLVEPGYGYSVNVTKNKTWVFNDKYSINEVKTASKIGNSIISRMLADSYRDTECRYSFSDEDYDSMPYSFEGTLLEHGKTSNFETGSNTIYIRCKESGIKDTSSYVYDFNVLEPTIQGVLYDSNTTDGVIADAEISFINMPDYTLNFNFIGNLSPDYNTYTNSTIVDAVTNESGNYAYNLADGKYSMFISKLEYYNERSYNILINETYSNISVDESMLIQPATKGNGNPNGDGDYNVEGHILYKERYNNQGHGNKYVCGETIKFVMFGIGNNIVEPVNVTFLIEDHSDGGAWHGVTRYIGNISNPAEILTVEPGDSPNGGVKTWKIFNFKIPCDWPKIETDKPKSRYDIHAYDETNEKWHEIGVWFLINGTAQLNVTPIETQIASYPAYNSTNLTTFTNESVKVYFVANEGMFDSLYPYRVLIESVCDNESNETVPCLEDDYVRIMGGTEIPTTYQTPYNIVVDQGNGKIINVPQGSTNFSVVYNVSDYYNMTVYSLEYDSPNATSTAIVWITEEEADAIAAPIYENEFFFLLTKDYNYTVTTLTTPFNMFVDRIDKDGREIGDEYLTPNNPNSEEIAGYPERWKEDLNNIVDTCAGGSSNPKYLKIIDPLTAVEYESTLRSYLTHLRDDCNAFSKSKKDKDKPNKKEKSIKDDIETIKPAQEKTTIQNTNQKEQTKIQVVNQPDLSGIRIIKSHKKGIFDSISEFFESIFSLI